jgi:hypothetical protein
MYRRRPRAPMGERTAPAADLRRSGPERPRSACFGGPGRYIRTAVRTATRTALQPRYFRNFEVVLSARILPPVWQVGQYATV